MNQFGDRLNALDLFTGYGGITLALQDYAKPVAFCEIDRYCQAILVSRMRDGHLPIAPIWDDVRTLRGNQFEKIDIIYGGFPCQDISLAGAGAGLAGKRSGLFFEMCRLVQEIKPVFVFLENVPGIRIRGLCEVVHEFAKMGYDCRWTCLSAGSIGAPHRRERWFLLAHTASERIQGLRTIRQQKSNCNVTKILPLRQGEAAKFSDWKTQPNVDRVADGIASRVDRIKALGNGVVPLQAKAAFELLLGRGESTTRQ